MSWTEGVREAVEHAKQAGVERMIIHVGDGYIIADPRTEGLADRIVDLLEAQNEAAARAVEHVELEWNGGEHFVRQYEDLLIFGRIVTDDELEASENDGTGHWEAFQELHAERQKVGFRFVEAWSVACTHGEFGDTHISTMLKITPEQFELARMCGWDPERIRLDPRGAWITTVRMLVP